ncbi:hypothetical protein E4656_11995 [Natronospirillum operosum]|uniref:SPW repeat-containing protein n=1 Tax=Natronospirillum operosum TaxID=2759953 RepID=A0A4Z0W5B7_9GAMM|nr:hypothetical protein [Natronospirillum operosum]TGG92842.1 hypothetical protein E4656_11995 [Natronospirillum operosum]
MKIPGISATLMTNILLSGLSGILLLAFPGLISDVMGGVPAWLLQGVGVGLLLFAAGVYGVRRALPDARSGVAWVLAFDVAWIVATPVVMVVFASQLSLWGHILLADVALIVTAFALLEWRWLKAPEVEAATG